MSATLDRPVTGFVADTISFSNVDGPGNRFVVFLQGCNFDCVACHNPYTIGVCTDCAEDIPFDRLKVEPWALRCVACEARHEST